MEASELKHAWKIERKKFRPISIWQAYLWIKIQWEWTIIKEFIRFAELSHWQKREKHGSRETDGHVVFT